MDLLIKSLAPFLFCWSGDFCKSADVQVTISSVAGLATLQTKVPQISPQMLMGEHLGSCLYCCGLPIIRCEVYLERQLWRDCLGTVWGSRYERNQYANIWGNIWANLFDHLIAIYWLIMSQPSEWEGVGSPNIWGDIWGNVWGNIWGWPNIWGNIWGEQ